MFSLLAGVVLVLTPLFGNFLSQDPQVSPTPVTSPGASPSPSPSPSPTPARAPSPTPLPGAQNFHQWGSVTVFNGLPSDSVRAIAQTPDGVMWFGTDNGLARFDGRRIQNIALGDAAVDRILALKVSPTGQLWIGTSSGAFVYSDNALKPVQNTETSAITAILFGTGYYYLGSDGGEVFRVYAVTDGSIRALRTQSVPALEDGQTAVTSLVEQNGIPLAATSGRGVLSVKDGGLNAVHTPPSPGVINALATGDGLLWLGTDAPKGVSGIYKSTGGERFERIAAPTSKVLTLEANDSGLWAGTERYGLFHFAGTKLKKNYTFENTSGGLRSNTIYELFTDREGVVWIGTNRGVSRFDRLGAFQQTVSDIPNSNFIRTLYKAADGRIYAGSNRGLFVQEDDKWTPVTAYGNRPIFALVEDRSGKLLVDSDVRSFADFRGGKLAAVSGVGLAQIGANGYTVVHKDALVSALCASGDRLWVGTSGNGLFSYDGRSVKLELPPETLRSGAIWRIAESADGTLWIAGQHGVLRIRDSKPETIIETEDVRDVFVDGDEVWAATTTRGLLHARQDPQFGWIVSSVAFEQGLPSEKAFSIMPISDGLLIATNRGVVTYKPGSIAPKLIATRILSQRVHDIAEQRSTIALDYPQNGLLVEVAGQSSRTFPEEFQYAFVLKNVKGEEVARQLSREPQYAPADLSPGEYAIESIAFNRDLLPSEPLTIRFAVAKAPFPWTATALAVLLLLSLVGLVWAVVEHRRIKQRNRELAAARLDLANEAERERRRIARDLHDQTLADLRSLMMTTDKLPDAGATVREEIESISTDIRRICEDLSPSVLENVGLVAALEFLLDRTVQSRSFVSDDSVEREIDFPLHVQLQIYRIAQEVLTNIARHSDADSVEMRVDMRDGDLVLTVRDNGTTFQPDGTPNGRGISNIRARANLINGRVAWKESSEGGNVFSLRIGAGNGHEN